MYRGEKKEEHLCEDFSDPGNWGKVDTRWRDLLVKIGPTTRPHQVIISFLRMLLLGGVSRILST